MEAFEGLVNKTFKKVIVIDDAYAPADVTDLDGDAVARFTNALQDEPRRVVLIKKEFNRASLDPSVPRDIEELTQDQATVRRLWALRGRKPWLWLGESLFLQYLDDVTQKQSDLDGLEQLFGRFKWKVDKLPRFDKTTLDIAACQVIFLDFFLKDEKDTENALQRAVEIGHLIVMARQQGKLNNYPLIVLMSSRPGAGANQKEFKERTGLRADFFCFIEKAEINTKINDKFASLMFQYEGKQALAHLLDEYWLAAIRSAQALRSNLAMVEPSELALLHEAELAVEGAVLPDYLSWLVSESLAAGLLEDAKVRKLGTALPKVIGHSAFPGSVPPSSRIADMFVRSIMRLDVNDDIAETKTIAVELGDLFAKFGAAGEPDEFFLVVDQSCDLARPDSSNKTNVLCLQCKPQRLSDVALAFYRHPTYLPDSAMADLVHMPVNGESRYYLAKWDMVNPITLKLADLDQRKRGLKRLARLKPVAALARQEGLTQRVGRIGEPVAPPHVTAYRAKLVLHGKNDFKREFDATKEAWASVVIVQGRHMPMAVEQIPAEKGGEQAKPKNVKSPKTSTTLSFTSDFGEYLLRKLDKAKLGDVQASSQSGILIDNIKVGAVQRLTLSAGDGDQGLDQAVKKAAMQKPKGTIHVVFDKSVPETLKAQPIVLLLTSYEEENPGE
jgi:hypothetical protein